MAEGRHNRPRRRRTALARLDSAGRGFRPLESLRARREA
jgi:hypothetical protein